jgi:hypothetical protein
MGYMGMRRGLAFVRSMVFGIVLLVCRAVPQYVVRCTIAVPQQHATFEHFAQTGAALHPACATIVRVCWTGMST